MSMTPYTKGYRAGWLSYLKECCQLESSLSVLVAEADTAAGYAGHGLLPPGDYWLGYHHGRAAAKARVTLHRHTYREPGNDLVHTRDVHFQ